VLPVIANKDTYMHQSVNSFHNSCKPDKATDTLNPSVPLVKITWKVSPSWLLGWLVDQVTMRLAFFSPSRYLCHFILQYLALRFSPKVWVSVLPSLYAFQYLTKNNINLPSLPQLFFHYHYLKILYLCRPIYTCIEVTMCTVESQEMLVGLSDLYN